MHVDPTWLAGCIVGVCVLADRFGLLDRWKHKSPADAAAELAIANETVMRLRAERDREREAKLKLEQTRSLEPVLEQLHANAELQAQVLERLVHHNGSFAHMESSMRELVESLKLLTGFIAGVVELPAAKTS